MSMGAISLTVRRSGKTDGSESYASHLRFDSTGLIVPLLLEGQSGMDRIPQRWRAKGRLFLQFALIAEVISLGSALVEVQATGREGIGHRLL
jgi:hypothetical protein